MLTTRSVDYFKSQGHKRSHYIREKAQIYSAHISKTRQLTPKQFRLINALNVRGKMCVFDFGVNCLCLCTLTYRSTVSLLTVFILYVKAGWQSFIFTTMCTYWIYCIIHLNKSINLSLQYLDFYSTHGKSSLKC